jgi:hypothetical protein
MIIDCAFNKALALEIVEYLKKHGLDAEIKDESLVIP